MRTPLAFAVVALLTLAFTGTASAKGPIEASITGPGLDTSLQIGDVDNWGKEDALAATQPIMQLAEASGFFPAASEQTPDPMLDRRPVGDLGPRYLVTYIVPSPNGGEDIVRQQLYPYAKGSPVTYMEPGQTLFGTEETRGGWYVASSGDLEETLVAAGLPSDAPDADSGSGISRTLVALLTALGGAAAAGTAVLRWRR